MTFSFGCPGLAASGSRAATNTAPVHPEIACSIAAAITSTDKIALQPLPQCVLAAGTAEPIGHQHQHSIGKRESPGLLHTVCFWRQAIQNVLQTQFAPQPARHQHRSPAGGKSRFNALGGRTAFSSLAAAQKLNQTLKMRCKEVFASQIGDDALFGMAVLPVSLH